MKALNTADVLCQTAAILADRQDDYGDAATSFERIAALWSPIIGQTVTAHQVALCMAQLKVSRAVGNPGHGDSYVDAGAYLAHAAVIAGADL